MKKYLSIIVGLMLLLGASSVFAANDLTLQTSTVISAGATYTVTGDYTMDSITVNADNFTVTLSPGGSLIITAPGGTPISASHSDGITADRVCSSAESRMQLVAKSTAGAETVTITSSGSCGGSSGGTTTTTTDTTTTTTDVTTTTVAPTTTTTSTTATSVVATPAVTTPIVATPAVSAPVSTVSAYTFATPLAIGSKGAAVTELQKRLISEGLLGDSYATGYFGSLTLAAVKKYQEKEGIATAGQAGYGNVGPMTRAALNSSAPVAVASTPAAVSTAPVSGLTNAQASSIIGLLESFGADASIIANVKASLGL